MPLLDAAANVQAEAACPSRPSFIFLPSCTGRWHTGPPGRKILVIINTLTRGLTALVPWGPGRLRGCRLALEDHQPDGPHVARRRRRHDAVSDTLRNLAVLLATSELDCH